MFNNENLIKGSFAMRSAYTGQYVSSLAGGEAL